MSTLLKKFFSKSFLKQLIQFAIVGAIGTLVNLSILYLLTEFLNVYYIVSEIIAFFVSVLNNYILNKVWTFKEKIQQVLFKKYIKYTLICLLSLIVNLSVLYLLVENFNFWYVFAEIVAIFISFIINFIGNKFWTFRDTNSKAINF
ncbi:MAG: GtrA family protein [Candidatus Hermodarchaeota archaeon]